MDAFFGLIGFLSLIVGSVMLIIAFIKKRPKKNPGIFMVVGLVMVIMGLTLPSDDVIEKESDVVADAAAQGDSKNTKTLTDKEFETMYSDPKKYKGAAVEFFGRVFVEPEKDDKGTYLQVFAKNNSDRNVLVSALDADIDIKTDDILYIKGEVSDAYKGENMMGGSIVAPIINANHVEISDYATAFSPAIKSVNVDEKIDQHGFQLTLDKIEIASEETRLHIIIENNSDNNLSFYGFNTKIISGDKQLESESNYEADYPEVQSDILPDIKTEGVITFPPLPEEGEIKVIFKGSSNDYSLDFDPFEFEIGF